MNSISNNHSSCLVQQNIPVNLSKGLKAKEAVHNFFRRPLVVKVLTFLLPTYGPLKEFKKLATIINQWHETFGKDTKAQHVTNVIHGGDKLETLLEMQKNPVKFHDNTTIEFSDADSLSAAREIKTKNNLDKTQAVGIFNFA